MAMKTTKVMGDTPQTIAYAALIGLVVNEMETLLNELRRGTLPIHYYDTITRVVESLDAAAKLKPVKK